MCDYSLETYRTRPARKGERYVTRRFASGSVGLASPGDDLTAVCVAPDTCLRLAHIPQSVQDAWGVGAEEEVTFVRLDDGPYHDGVRFRTGAQVTLQALGAGVDVTVTRSLADAAGAHGLAAAAV